MTATHAEVLRSLPPELDAARAFDGSRIRGEQGALRWELELSPEGTRRIGTLSLPLTELTIRLQGHTPEEGAHFIERLEQCCRRGGG
jgi:hypothetical protein